MQACMDNLFSDAESPPTLLEFESVSLTLLGAFSVCRRPGEVSRSPTSSTLYFFELVADGG